VAYLQLASESANSVVDESAQDTVAWVVVDASGTAVTRCATLPRVIFVRN
jgi:hypothetical protein